MSTVTTCGLFQSKDACVYRKLQGYTDSSQSKVKPTGEGKGGGTVERIVPANL